MTYLKNSHSLQRQVRNKHDDCDDNNDDDNLIYASNEGVLLPWKYHSNYAIINDNIHNIWETGHFWLHFCLYFKASQYAKSLLWITLRSEPITWLAATFSFPFAFPLVGEVLVFLVGPVFEPPAPFLVTAVATTFFTGGFVGLGALLLAGFCIKVFVPVLAVRDAFFWSHLYLIYFSC